MPTAVPENIEATRNIASPATNANGRDTASRKKPAPNAESIINAPITKPGKPIRKKTTRAVMEVRRGDTLIRGLFDSLILDRQSAGPTFPASGARPWW